MQREDQGKEMKKAETCVYNANRASNAIFNPYFTWRPFDEMTPPHIYWASKGVAGSIPVLPANRDVG